VRRAVRTAALAVATGALLLGAAGPAAAATPAPTPGVHSVPPAAPRPTDGGKSPAAPDPHPPRGGIGPLGEPVGGTRLLSRGLVTPAGAPALPTGLTARAWVLADLTDGTILAARDPHGRYQPASIQKILTVDTVLPRLPGSRTVTVSRAAADTEGSHAGLVPDGRYTVDDLFSGLLLVSGNDAAVALAQAAGGVRKTVAAMNAEALRLGAYDTFVQTPSGLDGWRQLTSAYDMTLFLRQALTLPRFVAYERQPRASLPAQHPPATALDPVRMVNQNEQFLTTVPGALVAKTGYTDAAQHTFAGAVRRHGRTLAVIFLRAQRWPTDQWQQATRLIDWGFALPAGTAPVGTLAAPVALPHRAVPSSRPGPVATTAASGPLGGGTDGHGRDPFEIPAFVALGLAVLATLALAVRRRKRPGRVAR
jgi:D-alanyl-D-alanine carboxypeptidase (penicillin-binding protein 5/6)